MTDIDPTPSQVRRAIAIGLPLIRKLDAQAAALFAAAGVEMPADFTVEPYSDDDEDDTVDSEPVDTPAPAPAPVPAPVPKQTLTTPTPASTSSSHALGRIGETSVLASVRRVWPTARDVSTRAHSGDIMIVTADGRICVEVKNYRMTVPAAQVDKFRADMDTLGAAAGLFVSVASPIAGIEATPLQIVWESRAGRFIPHAYMTMPSSAEIVNACSILQQLIGAIAYANALIREREDAYRALADVADAVDGLAIVRSSFAGVIGGITSKLASVAGDLRCAEMDIRMKTQIACSALDIVTAADDSGEQIFADPKFIAYGDATKNAIRGIVAHIAARTPAAAGTATWTVRGGAYLHKFSGVVLKLLMRDAKICIGCSEMAGDSIIAMLRDFPRDAAARDGALMIDIGPETIARVLALI